MASLSASTPVAGSTSVLPSSLAATSSPTIRVSGKVMGKTQPVFADWELALPVPAEGEPGLTLQGVLASIVRAEVAAFQERQAERRVMRILSPEQMAIGVTVGKISAGGSDLDQVVDVDVAVETALQAFKDGLYFVFIDEVQQDDLEQLVEICEGSQLLFLRLIALVGG